MFLVFSAFIFGQYSDISFKTDAFNAIYKIHTEDEKVLEGGEVKISCFDKLSLLTGCCVNKRK